MPNLQWFELSPPRDVDLDGLTAAMRTFASRPRYGFGSAPLVVLELWSVSGDIRYRLGVDGRIAQNIASQLTAHLPRLGVVEIEAGKRPSLSLGAEIRVSGMAAPLRVDMASAVSAGLLGVMRELRGTTAVVQWTLGPSHARTSQPKPFKIAESLGLRTTGKTESTTARLWAQKASEQLFACRGRIAATGSSTAATCSILRRVAGALKVASSQHATLRVGKVSANAAYRTTNVVVAPLSWSCVLNAAEVATLLGWPLEERLTEGLPVVGGHVNHVPKALRLSEDDVLDRPGERVLGASLHPAERGDLVVIPEHTSGHHIHVVGPTGSGKSTLLAGLVSADIAAGRSVLVIEPRGDLINDILAQVPENRRDDVVVIEPNDERSIGLNVLAGELNQAERRADQVVSLLAEMHGSNFGPRTADVALHAFIAISRLPDGTLPDVPMLLSNAAFRRRVLAQVSDPLVLGPFFAWYDALSEAERGQVISPLMNKLRAFLGRDALRRMLGQAAPLFDLGELFTKRRVVLINLNKGSLGAGASSMLGALILNQFWAAVQRRASVPAEQRHKVMVVIDEVQDYLHVPGIDLGDLFAQCRGLGVSMTVAHQHLDQLSTTQRAGLLANARSRIVFRPAPHDAKALAASMGGSLTGDDLLRLRAFEACAQLLVDSEASLPFSVRTRPLPPWRSDPHALRKASAERYGIDGAQLDAALVARWQGENLPPEGPVGFKVRGKRT